MKITKKIDAFTLAEILVVLVISAIIIGMAFTVLNLVQTNFRSIQNNFQNKTEIRQLEQQLTIDFNRFHIISYNKNSGELHFTNPIDSIVYRYQEDLLIREQDTFKTPIYGMLLFFDGSKVEDGEIDALKINYGNESRSYSFLSKRNSAKNYINRNGD